MLNFLLLQRMTNNIRFTFSVGNITRVVLSKTNRIGDTKYNIQCSTLLPCQEDLVKGGENAHTKGSTL